MSNDRGEVADDAEDIPSDFFDDFSKEEFMEGLSVIDSWDDEGGKPRGPRITEALDTVHDLRELIRDGRDDDRGDINIEKRNTYQRRSSSRKLDDFIKPGSRRDPNKTNEAIKRDKEVKVKEYLAKRIEGSVDDLRPPGTELDDYLDESKLMKKPPAEERENRRSAEKQRREPPKRKRHRSRSPRKHSPRQRSPRHSPRRSPYRSPRRSPGRSPRRRFSRSPLRFRREVRVFKPYGPRRSRSPRRSPRRFSPRWERRDHSRSPRHYHRSRSPSDSFLYPRDTTHELGFNPAGSYPQRDMFAGPSMDYPGGGPGFPYQPVPSPGFPGGFRPQYEYAAQPMPLADPLPPVPMPVPQPVPAPMPVPGPMMVPGPAPGPVPALNTIPLPVMVPNQMSPVPRPQSHQNKMDNITSTPFDALAQLVAEGKLSKQDYLKLAPNKSKSARFVDKNSSSSMETKARVEVLNRCNLALTKTANLRVPNHLVINLSMLGPEQKSLPPKFCSPLKRQATMDFFFTTPSVNAAASHNKQLIDSIYAAIGLTNVIARPKKKPPKNTKDASCQTTKPYCDVCEIRESTRSYDTSTSIDPEHFSSSIHTQVVEQDLLNSKSVFAPSGSIGDGAPMSIAHLTPAQLVSQLAARAKTLKQTEPPPPSNQFGRRPPGSYDYDYDNRGSQYQNYNNYNRY